MAGTMLLSCEDSSVERIPSVHSSYHGNFFLLRTPVAVHGAAATVTLNEKRSPQLTLPSFSQSRGPSVYISSVSAVVAKILLKYGVYHLDTFYYEDVPLFSVVFDSMPSLEMFLRSEDKLRKQLQNCFASQYESAARSAFAFLPTSRSLPPVDVSVELYHITPDHQQRSADVEIVTLVSCEQIMTKWKKSEVFNYRSIFGGSPEAKKLPNLQESGEREKVRKKQLKVKILTADDLREVLNASYPARKRWYEIGLELGISSHNLDSISGKNDRDCLRDVLIMWLKLRDKQPTWIKLTNALRSQVVGEEGVACDIEHQIQQKAEEQQSVEALSETHSRQCGPQDYYCREQMYEERLECDEAALKQTQLSKGMAEEELKLALGKVTDLQRKVDTISESKRMIEEELNETRKILDARKKIARIHRKKEEKHEDEISALQEEIDALGKKLQQKETKLRFAEIERQRMKQILSEAYDELEKKTTDVMKLSKEVEKLKSEQKLEKEINEAKERLLRASANSHEAQVDEMKVQFCEAVKRIKHLNQESKRLEEAVRECNQKITITEEELHAIRMDCERKSCEKDILSVVQMAKLKASLLQNEEEKERLQQKYELTTKEIEYFRNTVQMTQQVCPRNCRATGTGLESAECHTQTHFEIHLRDGCNEPFTGVGDSVVTTELRCVSDSSLSDVTVTSTTADVWLATYTPSSSGEHQLYIKVNDVLIGGNPFQVIVGDPQRLQRTGNKQAVLNFAAEDSQSANQDCNTVAHGTAPEPHVQVNSRPGESARGPGGADLTLRVQPPPATTSLTPHSPLTAAPLVKPLDHPHPSSPVGHRGGHQRLRVELSKAAGETTGAEGAPQRMIDEGTTRHHNWFTMLFGSCVPRRSRALARDTAEQLAKKAADIATVAEDAPESVICDRECHSSRIPSHRPNLSVLHCLDPQPSIGVPSPLADPQPYLHPVFGSIPLVTILYAHNPYKYTQVEPVFGADGHVVNAHEIFHHDAAMRKLIREQEQAVSRLAQFLEKYGIPTAYDQMLWDTTASNSLQWLNQQIEKSRFIILIVTPSLQPFVTATDPPELEQEVIGRLLYNLINSRQYEILPVFLNRAKDMSMPPIQSLNAVHVYELYVENFEEDLKSGESGVEERDLRRLYRLLTGQTSEKSIEFLGIHHLDQPATQNKGHLTIEHFEVVRTVLWSIRYKWYQLGIELNFMVHELESIHYQFRNESDMYLLTLISRWLQRPEPQATWSALITALKQPTIGQDDVALNIEKVFLTNVSNVSA